MARNKDTLINALNENLRNRDSVSYWRDLLERLGLFEEENPRENPWYFHIESEAGEMVCIFNPSQAAHQVYETVRGMLYPDRSEIIAIADSDAEDPNKIGFKILMERQEIWMEYYHESHTLLRKYFEPVFRDAMKSLIEKVLNEVIPKLDGRAGYYVPESIMEKYRRAGRPKRKGCFRRPEYFRAALLDVLDSAESLNSLTESKIIEGLNEHPFHQREITSTKTLRTWCYNSEIVRKNNVRQKGDVLRGIICWYNMNKQKEAVKNIKLRIRRKAGVEPCICVPFSPRAIDPATGKKLDYTTQEHWRSDPNENEFEVDYQIAEAAISTGSFEFE